VEFNANGTSYLGVWQNGKRLRGFEVEKDFWQTHNIEDYL